MTLTRFAGRARNAALAVLATLAGTTFQNGCTTNDMFSSLLNSLSSDYSYPSSGSNSSYNSYQNPYSGWSILDLPSG